MHRVCGRAAPDLMRRRRAAYVRAMSASGATATSGRTSLEGLLLLEGALVPGRIVLAHGRIASIERDETVARTHVVAPGLVDLHVHGHGGCEPDGDLDGMARSLARAGTTAFQPTLFPQRPPALAATAARVWAQARAPSETPRARAVGLHLEGPFVNPVRAGALPTDALVRPSPAALAPLFEGPERGLRTMTVAPELPGAGALVAELVRRGVRVSLGHSDADEAAARAAARAGATGATHLFNAMAPFHHRHAGLVGFALSQDALHAELIGDLVHVGEAAVELALAARGPGGLCLVSDALAGAGTGCDVFHVRGYEHHVRDGAAWFDPEAGPGAPARRDHLQLAGSAMDQLAMVRRLVARGLVGLADALVMASQTPARALGLEGELGVLRAGAAADVIVLVREDLRLAQVFVGGIAVT